MTSAQMIQRAAACHQAGDLQQAQALCREALEIDPNEPNALNYLGTAAQQAGRMEEAADLFGKAVAAAPQIAHLQFNLSLALAALKRWDASIAAARAVVGLEPNHPDFWNHLGSLLRRAAGARASLLREAAAAYQRSLQLRPDDFRVLNNVAEVWMELGDLDQAVAAFTQVRDVMPDLPEPHANLGLALSRQENLDAAVESYRQALKLKPQYAQAHCGLGAVLRSKGDLAGAVAAFERAIALNPQAWDSHYGLGMTLRDLGRIEPALAAIRRGVELNPQRGQSHCQLGHTLCLNGDFDAGMDCLKTAVELAPNDWSVLNEMAATLWLLARPQESIATYDKALAANPSAIVPASGRIFTLGFDSTFDAPAILRENIEWDRRFALPLRKSIAPHENDRDPRRRLRIGYVSPDFRDHCQALFTTPLLRAHDHSQFEIVAYSAVLLPDAVTQRLHGFCDLWRNTVGMSDASVAQMIRADKIDILVDLTMHMAHGRPLVFARKPAPVQVAWLAYPGTTGIATIDYRFTDPFLDPPGENDSYYSEKSIRLPDTFWCYDALGSTAQVPEVSPLPTERNGFITFGCLNNFCKITPPMLELWADVMRQTRSSRLLMLAPRGEARKWVTEQLAKHGITADRLDFADHQPRSKYLAEFSHIDLCLDELPANGHTTSLDSFWMGVPVVTRVGSMVLGRAGWSQLSNLGLTELAGNDDELFVKIAVDLADDLPRLAELRRTLRQCMASSPLTDGARFAAGVETAYRKMWHTWCSRP